MAAGDTAVASLWRHRSARDYAWREVVHYEARSRACCCAEGRYLTENDVDAELKLTAQFWSQPAHATSSAPGSLNDSTN